MVTPFGCYPSNRSCRDRECEITDVSPLSWKERLGHARNELFLLWFLLAGVVFANAVARGA